MVFVTGCRSFGDIDETHAGAGGQGPGSVAQQRPRDGGAGDAHGDASSVDSAGMVGMDATRTDGGPSHIDESGVRDSHDDAGHPAGEAPGGVRCDPDSTFNPPTPVSSVNDKMYSVQGAVLDGSTLYFAGKRGAADRFDIFVSTGEPDKDSFGFPRALA